MMSTLPGLGKRRFGASLWRTTCIAVLAGFAAVALATTTSAYSSLRERAFDLLTGIASLPPAAGAIIVDIDRDSLREIGGWPWSRERLAQLIAKIATAQPKAIGIDILLDGRDELSPAALARKLAMHSDSPEIGALARDLPDGDVKLADALGKAPAILGLALDPAFRSQRPATRPFLIRGNFDASRLWREPGLVGPPPQLVEATAGLGALALPGDRDGTLRRLPLVAVAGEQLVPGLALELFRVAYNAPFLTLQAQPRAVLAGARTIPFEDDGMLRLVQPRSGRETASGVSAKRILAGEPAPLAMLHGRIVLIGSSAPEAGGLRVTGSGELVASVALHAAAYQQMTAGVVPRRPAWLQGLEVAAIPAAAVLGGALGFLLAPWAGLLATLASITGWCLLSMMSYLGAQHLLDPLAVPATLAVSLAASAITVAADTKRREARIRQRFEQHLSPAVVAKMIADPAALRLEGQVREITALFTDIEGFTSMTSRATPHALISVLDAYFDGVSRIIVEHGGMVNKIVGDAVHAIFNAPFDLADHPQCALDCARSVERFANAFRSDREALALGFGRTRIGIETGPAIVGDVGGSRKLDYTAHGNAVNAAARLEAANKDLGTSIAIGAGAAARLNGSEIRAIGHFVLRGQQGAQCVYTTWPADFDAAERSVYDVAVERFEADPNASVQALSALLELHPADQALRSFIGRLRKQACAASPDGLQCLLDTRITPCLDGGWRCAWRGNVRPLLRAHQNGLPSRRHSHMA